MMHTLEHKHTKRAKDTHTGNTWAQITAAEVYNTTNLLDFKKLELCQKFIAATKKVGNARWILYMVVSDKNSPREQRKQLNKAHELQAKPNTRMDNPAHWPSNQPQLSRGDKMWHNSRNQWTPTDAACHLHPSPSPTTGKMRECSKWSTNTDDYEFYRMVLVFK